jgi:predicted nucleotidyltransferase
MLSKLIEEAYLIHEEKISQDELRKQNKTQAFWNSLLPSAVIGGLTGENLAPDFDIDPHAGRIIGTGLGLAALTPLTYNYARLVTKDNPKATNELLTKLHSLKNELKQQFGIEEIALFGSYARGEADEDSDIDIAIMKVNKKDYFKRIEAKYYLEDLLQKKVDIGYFDSIRPIIQKYIKKDLVLV